MKPYRFSIVPLVFLVTGGLVSTADAYYHAQMGRFTSRDPAGTVTRLPEVDAFIDRDPVIIPSSGYADGYNLYQYTQSRPTIGLDPTGLLCFCATKLKGKLYIDCSCVDEDVIVIPEKGDQGPIYNPRCGEWMDADGVVLNGQVWKVHGSTCVTIECTPEGVKSETCRSFFAALVGQGAPDPVPPGTFANEPDQGECGTVQPRPPKPPLGDLQVFPGP